MKMNEMEYNGRKTGLNSNPAVLHVYRKRHHNGNTTPAGIGQSMDVWHFSTTNPTACQPDNCSGGIDKVGQALIPFRCLSE